MSGTIQYAFEDNENTITYKQSLQKLVSIQFIVNEFIDVLRENIFDLSRHYCMKETESAYLKLAKENLDSQSSII